MAVREVIIIMSDHNDNIDKGATPMEIAVMLQKRDKELISEMDAYILKLKQQPKTEAKGHAIKALKRTGVLNSNGRTKKKIVSWE